MEPTPQPSTAQKSAGNYRKLHTSVHEMKLAIETEKGATRSGVGKNGKKWSVKMPAHYGYIKNTEGADGDHVDMYLGPHPQHPRVHVVDQVDPDTRKFDEHKALIGFPSRRAAIAAYHGGFSDGSGPRRIGHVTSMDVGDFKNWLAAGKRKRPIGKHVRSFAEGGSIDDPTDETDMQPGEPEQDAGEEFDIVSDAERKRYKLPDEFERVSPNEASKFAPPSGRESTAVGAFGRAAAEEAAPMVGSLYGMGLGAGAGSALGPVGTFVGGAAGAFAGAAGVKAAQNKILELIGLRDIEQERADEEQHPWARTAGGFLPAAAAFSPGPLAMPIAKRLATGVGVGAFTAGTEAVQGEFNPSDIALGFLQGALLPNARPGAAGMISTGERVGKRIAGRPDQQPQQPITDPSRLLPPPNRADFTVDTRGQTVPQTGEKLPGSRVYPQAPETPQGGAEFAERGFSPDEPGWPDQGEGTQPIVRDANNLEGAGGQGFRVNAEPVDIFSAPDGIPADMEASHEPTPGARVSNTASPADTVTTSPAKTDEFIARSKAEAAASEPLKADTRGNSPVQAQPAQTHETIGNVQSRPVADQGNKGKHKKQPTAQEGTPTATTGLLDPTVTAAVTEQVNRKQLDLTGGRPRQAPEETPTPAPPEHPAIAQRQQAQPRILQDTSVQRGQPWQEAIQAARKLGMPDVAHELETRGDDSHAQRFLDHVRDLMPREQPTAPEARPEIAGTETKAKSYSEARKASNETTTADEIFQRHGETNPQVPTKIEDRKAFQERLRGAVTEYKKAVGHPDLEEARASIMAAYPEYNDAQVEAAVNKLNKKPYKANEATPAQRWLTDAEKIANLKTPPTTKRATEFIANEKLLRSGNKEDTKLVNTGNKIEGGLAKRMAKTTESREAELTREDLVSPQEAEEWGNHVVLTPEDVERISDHQTLADNLADLDHEGYMDEVRRGRAEPTGIDNGPVRKDRTPKETYSEKVSRELGEKMKAQREARKARDESKPRTLKEIGKEFLNNEEGAIDPQKVYDYFRSNAKDMIGWWDRLIKPAITPQRYGRMGTAERSGARIAEAVMSSYNAFRAHSNNAHDIALDAHYKIFDKLSGDTALNFLINMEHGTPQHNKELQPSADFFRHVLDVAFHAEKSFGSKAEWVNNYLPHIWKDPAAYRRWEAQMIDAEGPTWFEKHRSFDTIAEAMAKGRLELKFKNPAELVSQRLMASVSMQAKMQMMHELNQFGLAHPLVEAPTGLKGQGWMQVKMPDQQTWLIAPEAQPLWKNVLDKEDLWRDSGVKGSVFRAWMKAKNTWVPLKLGLSAFHAIHVAHIHWQQAMSDGFTFNGAKDKFGLPTNMVEAGKAIKGAAEGAVRGAKEIGGIARGSVSEAAKGTMFEPLFKPTDGFREKYPGLKALDSFKKAGYDLETMQALREGGMIAGMPEHFKIRAGRAFNSAWKDGRYMSVALNAIPNFQEKFNPLQKVMFEHWIPALKVNQYLTARAHMLAQHPEYMNDDALRRVASTRLARNIDERYGEMFYNNLMWNKNLKNLGIAADLSLGWNLGFLHTTVGAITDTARSLGIKAGIMPKRTPVEQAIHDASNKASYVASYAGSAMLFAGVMSWALSGDAPSGMDFVYPRAGGVNPDGSPRRLSTMFYTREPVQLYKHAEEQDSWIIPKFVPGVGAMAHVMWNKMILAPVVNQMQNRDYFGYQVYDPHAPWYTQLYQRGKSLAKELFEPVSISGAEKAQSTGGGMRDKALSYAGFGPAPSYVNKSPLQNRIAHLFYEGPGAGVKPYENRERDQQRRDLRSELDRERKAGDREGVRATTKKLEATGQTPQQIAKFKYGQADVYQFGRLDRTTQKALVRDMSQEDFKRYVTPSTPGHVDLNLYWQRMRKERGLPSK